MDFSTKKKLDLLRFLVLPMIVIFTMIVVSILTMFLLSCDIHKPESRDSATREKLTLREVAEPACELEAPMCSNSNVLETKVCKYNNKVLTDRYNRECYLCSNMNLEEVIWTNRTNLTCVTFCNLCN